MKYVLFVVIWMHGTSADVEVRMVEYETLVKCKVAAEQVQSMAAHRVNIRARCI